MLKYTVFALAIFVAGAVGTAGAQKNEVAVLYGKTFTADRNILPNGGFSTAPLTFTTGAAYQVTYARQIFNPKLFALYVEVPFVASPKILLGSTSGGNAAHDYSTLFLTPGVRVKLLPGARVSPWISAGYGFARFTASSALLDGAPNRLTISKNTTALQLGAGLDVHLYRRISLRGEIRDFYADVPPLAVAQIDAKAHGLVYSGGVVIRF